MVNDPTGDFLTRLRNAQLRKQEEVVVPTTRIISAIAEILKKNNYIEDYSVSDDKGLAQQNITVKLKYIGGEPAMRSLERISKPGLRKYLNYKEIPKVLNGKGIGIFSTSKGVLSNNEAKTQKVGGEYLCEIW